MRSAWWDCSWEANQFDPMIYETRQIGELLFGMPKFASFTATDELFFPICGRMESKAKPCVFKALQFEKIQKRMSELEQSEVLACLLARTARVLARRVLCELALSLLAPSSMLGHHLALSFRASFLHLLTDRPGWLVGWSVGWSVSRLFGRPLAKRMKESLQICVFSSFFTFMALLAVVSSRVSRLHGRFFGPILTRSRNLKMEGNKNGATWSGNAEP